MPEFQAGPPGGVAENYTTKSTSPKPRWFRKNPVTGKREIPFELLALSLMIGADGYMLYAFCWLIVWHRIREHDEGSAIAILTIFCVLNGLAYMWIAAVHLWGPGNISTLPHYTKNTDADAPFPSDSQGYSLYCSYCQHIKPARAHHSTTTNTCVPAFDHFCPWLLSVIGQGNVKFFISFAWTVLAMMILEIVTLIVYQHRPGPINGNAIALYCVTGLIFMFSGMLVVQHSMYIALGHTLIESMQWRKQRLPYYNFIWKGDVRRVYAPTRKEIFLPRHSPYSMGIWRNITSVMGSPWMWLLPIRPPIFEPQISESFVAHMRENIDRESSKGAASTGTVVQKSNFASSGRIFCAKSSDQ